MAATPSPPNWWDVLLGGGVIGALVSKVIDWWRSASRGRRRDDVTVEVAKITSRDKRISDLEERMDRRDIEHDREIAALRAESEAHVEKLRSESEADRRSLRLEQDSMRREIAAIALRMDNAIGGDPAELLTALREIVYELRLLAGHETFPGKPTIIGNIEPKRGEVPPLG